MPARWTGRWRRVTAFGLFALAVSGAARAQETVDNELDRFMARVLERRDENAAARLRYVLDERSQVRVTGPDGAAIWAFRGEYTWYARDGVFVRSPVRIDGVTIDEAQRREYEADWLRQERRRAQRRREERRSPARASLRSTRENVRLAVERLWGGRIEGDLLDAIVENAEARGDDHAAIVAAADRILVGLGGVPAVGFDRAVERAHDGFAMLEAGRLDAEEVAAMLDRAVAAITPAAATADADAFARFLELFDLAARFDVLIAPVDPALVARSGDPAADVARAAALAERLRALAVVTSAAAAGGRDDAGPPASERVWTDGIEPRFLSDAYYFLDFPFEPGNYYLVGRERLDGHDVLRIEYYPERPFADPDENPDDPPAQGRAAEIESALGRTLLVTLWIEPVRRQIVRYTFDNLGFDFLPGRWLFRLDDVTASMTMNEPFDGVWLPARMDVRATVSLALGSFELTAARTYTDYREAKTGGRLLWDTPEPLR